MSRTRIAVLAVAGVLIALFGGRWLALRYTEALWFADLGRDAQARSLLAARLLWQALTFLAASLWFGLQVAGVYASIGSVQLPRRIGNLEIAEAVPPRVLRAIAAALALGLGLLTAVTFHDLADYVALYRAAVPLGVPEPVLGRDASFYLARLPLLETLHLMAAIGAVVALALAGGLYALTGSLVLRRRQWAATPHARTHLVLLLAVLALVLAWGFQIDAYQLVGGGGSDGGALTAVDRGLRIPASTTVAALALVVAALTVLFVRWGGFGGLLGTWATFALIVVIGRYVAPMVDQARNARPERSVALALGDLADRYARAGLGVAGVRAEDLPAAAAVSDDSLERLGPTLAGVSPWATEPALLPGWFDAVVPDTARPRLWTVTTSAYEGPDGRPRLVAVGVPETDAIGFLRGRERPAWTLGHRDRLAWGGPALTLALAPDPAEHPDTAAVPPVRVLAHEADLGVVAENGRAPGEPPAGIRLAGFVRRLLLAWSLQSPPLLGRRTTPSDRVLYWRDVPERLARLYPFASFVGVRAVLAGGRLVWLAPGFLASGRFPLAEQVAWQGESVNYLRAPYIAAVDAGTGATRLYLRGADTAFAARLAREYAADPLPAESLPDPLRAHLGYPASLFAVQAEVLAHHHGEPGQPAWAVARQPTGEDPGDESGRRPPALEALLPLRGPWEPWRLLPLADGGGNRLVAFVAAPESGTGPLVPLLLRLSTLDLPTLAAAESRLNATPAVVGALAAAAGPDGAVRRSPVLAVPAGGTVVYVQTVFASARRVGEPLHPAAVVLMAGGRVGVGADVATAAHALASARARGLPEVAATDSGLARARSAFLALDSATRRADWPAFGRAMESLRRALGLAGTHKP